MPFSQRNTHIFCLVVFVKVFNHFNLIFVKSPKIPGRCKETNKTKRHNVQQLFLLNNLLTFLYIPFLNFLSSTNHDFENVFKIKIPIPIGMSLILFNHWKSCCNKISMLLLESTCKVK